MILWIFQKCQDFIKWNLQLIAQTPDFGNFEPEILINILQQDDIVIVDEMTLLEYVLIYIKLSIFFKSIKRHFFVCICVLDILCGG